MDIQSTDAPHIVHTDSYNMYQQTLTAPTHHTQCTKNHIACIDGHSEHRCTRHSAHRLAHMDIDSTDAPYSVHTNSNQSTDAPDTVHTDSHIWISTAPMHHTQCAQTHTSYGPSKKCRTDNAGRRDRHTEYHGPLHITGYTRQISSVPRIGSLP